MTVRIDSIAAGGEGVGRLPDGRVTFVHRTAPGDLAEIVLTETKERWTRGQLLRVLEPVGLYDAAMALEEGRVQLADGTVVRWEPADYVQPVSEACKSYFETPRYLDAVATSRTALLDAGLRVVDVASWDSGSGMARAGQS